MLFFLTVLNIINIAILLLIKILIIKFLIKLFKNGATLSKIIKFIIKYEIAALLFFLIYEKLAINLRGYIGQKIFDSSNLVFLIYFVPFFAILFLLFFYFAKPVLSLNRKKMLCLFVLLSLAMYFVVPLLNRAMQPIGDIPIFANELSQITLLDFSSGRNSHPIFSATTIVANSIINPGYYFLSLAPIYLNLNEFSNF